MTRPSLDTKYRFLACAAALITMSATSGAHAAGFKTLLSFNGASGGAQPWAGVIRDGAGNLYGTTTYGGNTICASGCGIVFKLSPDGTETVLHSFSGPDGYYPLGGLLRDSAGNLYGTAQYGGAIGYGTIFELAPDGTFTILHSFSHNDGTEPWSGVISDGHGNLYGTTYAGGTGLDQAGTAYMLAPDGTFTVLHDFNDGSDGGFLESGLTPYSKGRFVGAALSGGGAYGTIYEVTKGGNEKSLYTFGNGDAQNPVGGLIKDGAGNLYGTTESGGAYNMGAVYEISSAGTETVLYSFAGGTDGASPFGSLFRDSAGTLYGTTFAGGNQSCGGLGCGTIFKFTTGGSETVIHVFKGTSDGGNPTSGLVADKRGNLYGTTQSGGTNGTGTVFRIEE